MVEEVSAITCGVSAIESRHSCQSRRLVLRVLRAEVRGSFSKKRCEVRGGGRRRLGHLYRQRILNEDLTLGKGILSWVGRNVHKPLLMSFSSAGSLSVTDSI